MDSETRTRISRAFIVIDAYAEQADKEALYAHQQALVATDLIRARLWKEQEEKNRARGIAYRQALEVFRDVVYRENPVVGAGLSVWE